jgi:hypothetical protein
VLFVRSHTNVRCDVLWMKHMRIAYGMQSSSLLLRAAPTKGVMNHKSQNTYIYMYVYKYICSDRGRMVADSAPVDHYHTTTYCTSTMDGGLCEERNDVCNLIYSIYT